jgi:thioredoxin 1
MTTLNPVTDDTFATEVLQASGPVLVEFWAVWCGPCRQVSPVVEQLAQEWDGRLKVVTMNLDENIRTSSTYRVMSVPTLKVWKDGVEVASIVGAKPKRILAQQLEPFIGQPRS